MVYEHTHSCTSTPTLSFVSLKKLGRAGRLQQKSHFSNFYDLGDDGAYWVCNILRSNTENEDTAQRCLRGHLLPLCKPGDLATVTCSEAWKVTGSTKLKNKWKDRYSRHKHGLLLGFWSCYFCGGSALPARLPPGWSVGSFLGKKAVSLLCARDHLARNLLNSKRGNLVNI